LVLVFGLCGRMCADRNPVQYKLLCKSMACVSLASLVDEGRALFRCNMPTIRRQLTVFYNYFI